MRQRVSVITLGVADLARARAFYEALGWKTGATIGRDPHWMLTEDGGVRLG